MVRNAFLLLLGLLLVASMAGFAQSNLVFPYVYKAANPITIDGVLNDTAWNFCYPIDFSRESISDSSRAWAWVPETDQVTSGRLYMSYDDKYFYFGAKVTDNSPGYVHGWAATGVEFYLSNEHLATTAFASSAPNGYRDTLGTLDLQLAVTFGASADTIYVNEYANGTAGKAWVLKGLMSNADIKVAVNDAGNAYVMEGRILWDSLKSSTTGNALKFTSGTRIPATWSLFHAGPGAATDFSSFRGYQFSKNQPSAFGPNSWQVLDVYGAPDNTWKNNTQFSFVKPYVRQAPKGNHISSGVTIDAKLPEWNSCFPIDFNRGSIPDSSRAHAWMPETDQTTSGRLYMMYDDKYFYFAANVTDNSPGYVHGWAATGVEFYLSNEQLSASALSSTAPNGYRDTLGVFDLQLAVTFGASADTIFVNEYANGTAGKAWVLKGLMSNADIKVAINDAGNAYIMEGRVPWDSLKSSITGASLKFQPGKRIPATWSLFHAGPGAATDFSSFRGYQFSKNQPSAFGPNAWQAVDIKTGDLVQDRVTTNVRIVGDATPTTFALLPAYPNPFNPSTTIQYTLSKAGATSLTVYNLLGQQVATILNNAYLGAGTYKVSVDMSGFTSGVYFSVLEQGSNRAIQKMMLLK